MENRIYTLEVRPGGLFMGTEDFMALLQELTELGVGANVNPGEGKIFFSLKDEQEN